MAFASSNILNFLGSSPDYGKIGKTAAIENLKDAAARLNANAQVHGSGMDMNSRIDIAKIKAPRIVAAGQADGTAAAWGGAAQGFGAAMSGLGTRLSKTPGFGGDKNTISGYGMNSFDDYTEEFTKAADMRGFPQGGLNLSGTMYSGFPNTNLG